MKRRKGIGVWLVLVSLGPVALIAAVMSYAQGNSRATPLILTGDQTQYALGRYLDLFEDPTGQLTITEVAAPDFTARFRPSMSRAPYFGFTDSAIWARLRLNNQTATADWLLEVEEARLSRVELYRPIGNGAGFERQEIGFLLPFADREIPHYKLLFRLPLPPQADQTIYLRFQSQSRISLPLTLWTPQSFAWFDHTSQFWWGLYYGILLIMAGYNLFLFLALGERSYLYLVLFISALIVNVSVLTGRAKAYLWFDLGHLNIWLVLVTGLLTVIFLLKFTSSFLETESRAPGLHRLIMGWVIILPALQLAALPWGFQAAFAALLVPTIPIIVTLAWAGLAIWRQGFRPARYFVLAELIPLLLGIFDILSLLGLLPEVAWFRQTSYVGNVMLVLFMSLALADRINLLKAETETVERRLNQFLDAVPVGLAIQDSRLRVEYVNSHALQMMNLTQPVNYATTEPMSLAENAASFPVFVAGTDQLYPLEQQPLGQALQGRSATADDIELLINDERVRLETWSSPIFDEQQQLIYVISAFHDITRRKQEEAELAQYREQLAHLVEARTAELRQANQSLSEQRALAESISKIAATVNRSLDLETVLAESLRQLKRVVGYQSAAVWLQKGDAFVLTKTEGITELEAGQWPIPASSHPLSLLFDLKPPPPADASLPRVMTWGDEQIGQHWVGIPLAAGARIMGALILKNDQTALSANEIKALETFADFTAVAVINAKLYEQAQATATTRERERLARDLHDAVTQILFAASIVAETLPTAWQQAPPEARQNVEKLRQLTRGALAEMRSLLLELRPTALMEAPLENLLTHLSEAMTGRSQIPVRLQLQGDSTRQQPPPEVKTACYRVAQEAFNNVIKHARATEVNVVFSNRPQALLLQISDNGCGFNPTTVPAHHMGLAIMRERTAAVGAALYIDSRPGQGTELAFQWPATSEGATNGS